MLKRLVYILFVLVVSSSIYSQNLILDNLLLQLSKHKDDTQRVNLLNNIGLQYLEFKPDESQNYFKRADTLASKLDYWYGKRNALIYNCRVLFYLGRVDECINSFHKALKVFVVRRDIQGIARCYYHMGNLFNSMGKKENAEYYYLKAFGLEKLTGNTKKIIEITNALARTHIETEKYSKAIEILNNSLKLQLEIKDQSKINDTYFLLGQVSAEIEDYPMALVYFNEALIYVEKRNDEKKLGTLHNGIGITLKRMGNFDDAIAEFKLAIKYFKKIEHYEMLSIAMDNLADVYFDQKKYELAKQTWIECLLKAKLSKLDQIVFVANTYSKISLACMELNNLDEAINYNLKAYQIEMSNDVKKEKVFTLVGLGECLKRKKNYTESRKYFSEALNCATQIPMLKEIPNIYNNLYKIDSCLKNTKSAFKNLLFCYRYRDSLLLDENAGKKMQEEARYFFNKKLSEDSLKHANELISEKKQIEVEKKELEKEQTELVLILIVSLLMAVLILFLIKRLLVINKQKKIIKEQNSEYNGLLREIHQQVKNNLQVIISIIDLESTQQVDKNAISSFNDIKTRITSISLIHEVLYDQNQFESIHAPTYFTLLFESLKKMYNNKLVHLKITNKIDDFWLESNLLIPMALIVNELYSNSYKHGVNEFNELEIKFEMMKVNNDIKMVYSDSGNDSKKIQLSDGLGMRLIHLLIKQINGNIKQNLINKKFSYEFTFNIST